MQTPKTQSLAGQAPPQGKGATSSGGTPSPHATTVAKAVNSEARIQILFISEALLETARGESTQLQRINWGQLTRWRGRAGG